MFASENVFMSEGACVNEVGYASEFVFAINGACANEFNLKKQ